MTVQREESHNEDDIPKSLPVDPFLTVKFISPTPSVPFLLDAKLDMFYYCEQVGLLYRLFDVKQIN